jgi:uncharacterized protein involved in exopolysaccharide biosynthesis
MAVQLSLYQALVDIKVPPDQAGEVVKSLEKHMDDTFAKLSAVERLEARMGELFGQVRADMNAMRAELNAENKQIRADMNTIRAEIGADIAKSHRGLLMAMFAILALGVLELTL